METELQELKEFPTKGNILVGNHQFTLLVINKIKELFTPWTFSSKTKSKFKSQCQEFIDTCLSWNKNVECELNKIMIKNTATLVLNYCGYDGNHAILTNAFHAPMYANDYIPFENWIDTKTKCKNKFPDWPSTLVVYNDGRFLRGFDYVILESTWMGKFNETYYTHFDTLQLRYEPKLLFFDVKRKKLLDCTKFFNYVAFDHALVSL